MFFVFACQTTSARSTVQNWMLLCWFWIKMDCFVWSCVCCVLWYLCLFRILVTLYARALDFFGHKTFYFSSRCNCRRRCCPHRCCWHCHLLRKVCAHSEGEASCVINISSVRGIFIVFYLKNNTDIRPQRQTCVSLQSRSCFTSEDRFVREICT